jgi:8-oxo-dGTP diphosphatase
MTEHDFLNSYDPDAFKRPSVTVDLVLMTVREGRLAVLLQERADHPFKDHWALPGGFVGIDEGLDEAAGRILMTKAGLPTHGWLEQLFTFGAPARDPRMRIITVVYFALLPLDVFSSALKSRSDLHLISLGIPWVGERGGPVLALSPLGANLSLAFDHDIILGTAVARLRGKIDYTDIAFSLLPELFTLRDLQDVHEAILGVCLNKPAFRRRMIDKGWIEGTGERELGVSYRPAELYRRKDTL